MYEGFAWLYDDLNAAADYDALARRLVQQLQSHGIAGGIVADLGCGTGEVSLRLAEAGYDMLAIDASQNMLAVFREKLDGQDILLLCQRLEQLDLYGTIRAAVCCFDTLNHLAPQPLQQALRRISLFMEPGGVLLFDANTPHKHRQVLADNTFVFEDGDFACHWQNLYKSNIPATHIIIRAREAGVPVFEEEFFEYEYSLTQWKSMLAAAGFAFAAVEDGEGFCPLAPDSQRYLITAIKA